VRRETSNVLEEEHSVVLRFTFYVLRFGKPTVLSQAEGPFTVLEGGILL
jgi:hypothetical protein